MRLGSSLLCAWLGAVVVVVVDAGKNPCHNDGTKGEKSNCDVITIPQGFCRACHVNDYLVGGKDAGDFKDCTRTYTVENSVCLDALQDYVDMNSCDGARKDALEGYNKNGNNRDRMILDYFAYSICENTCDCIPKEGAFREVPVVDVHRGNCQAHPYYDICRFLPQIKLIRLDGTPNNANSLPKACPLLTNWFKSPHSKHWGSAAFTPVQKDVKYFLNRLMEAGEILSDVQVYHDCYDLERNQSRIDPPPQNGNPPPFPAPTPNNDPAPTPNNDPAPSPQDNDPSPTPPTDLDGEYFSDDAVIRLNAGGENMEWKGLEFLADGPYVSGGQEATPTKNNIANTAADFFYQTERWGVFEYDITVPVNGAYYKVALYFAEVHGPNKKDNERVFNINVQDGQHIWNNVDVHKDAGGGDTPHRLETEVLVTDGKVKIAFQKGAKKNPKISGLEIIPVKGGDDNSTPPPPPVDSPPEEEEEEEESPDDSDPESPPSPSPSGIAVTSLTLVNADTNKDIYELKDMDIVDVTAIGTENLNIRANVAGGNKVQSVQFTGTHSTRTENVAPYAFAGDGGGNYKAFKFPLETQTIIATPYPEKNAKGNAGTDVTVMFTVLKG